MSNEKVIIEFLNHKKASTPLRDIYNGYYSTYKGRTLQTDGIELINYKTKIAYFNKREENTLYLNITKYSQTTSKIQNTIKRLATERGLIIKEYRG